MLTTAKWIFEERRTMLKLRMMGTPADLQKARQILLQLEEENRVYIGSISGMYANKETNEFYRMYAEIKTPRKGKNNYEGEEKR